MNDTIIICERCGKPIKTKKVSLELSQTDGLYYESVPQNHISQGFFDFGKTCAKLEIANTKAKSKQKL